MDDIDSQLSALIGSLNIKEKDEVDEVESLIGSLENLSVKKKSF